MHTPINVNRPDPLELPPAPQKTSEVEERESRGATEGETNLLLSVGKKLSPEGTRFIGSAAFHVYQHPISGEFFILTQTANLCYVPESIALQCSKELARKAMQTYGHTPPRRRDDPPETLLK